VWSPSKAAALRAAKRRPAVYPDISPIPFLSVSLALLFFFLGMPVPTGHGLPIVPPETQNATPQPGAVREDAMRVAIARDGHVFFRQTAIAPEQLPDLIRTAVRKGAEKRIYLLADRRAKYADVKVVIDQIQLSGIRDVVILANKPTRPKF